MEIDATRPPEIVAGPGVGEPPPGVVRRTVTALPLAGLPQRRMPAMSPEERERLLEALRTAPLARPFVLPRGVQSAPDQRYGRMAEALARTLELLALPPEARQLLLEILTSPGDGGLMDVLADWLQESLLPQATRLAQALRAAGKP